MKKWFGLAVLLLVCSCDVKKGNGNDVTENESATKETSESNQIVIPTFAESGYVSSRYGTFTLLDADGNPIQFDSYEKYESLAIPSFWLGLVLYDMYHVVHNHFDSIYGGPGGSYEKVEQMTVDLLLSCVSNNVETIEEYDRMVGIEIPDNLKQELVKDLNSSFKYIVNECETREVDMGTRGNITYALVKERGHVTGRDILTITFHEKNGNLCARIEWTDDLFGF